jgi:hypothetical protein
MRPMSTRVVVKCNCTKQVFIFFYICIAVWDPIIKRRGLGPISQFNPATFLCLSQARTLISNVIHVCCGLFFMFNDLSWEVLMFCLNCLFITDITWYKFFIDLQKDGFFSSTKINVKHNIIEILLKVVLNTNYSKSHWCLCCHWCACIAYNIEEFN